MRVVQLIDSLEVGGAEKMAVSIANALSENEIFSGLIVTRKEGALKKLICASVDYIFVSKKKTFDFKALLQSRKYLIQNKVTHIHAHGSSYFFGVLIKIICPKIKLIWHDHHGNRVKHQVNLFVKLSSIFFNGVLTVNKELEDWSRKNLLCKKVLFLPNFVTYNKSETPSTNLYGNKGKRILCVANLRNPKNHITLLKAFIKSNAISEGWTLHLVGKDNQDEYSSEIKKIVSEQQLNNQVFFYGVCMDTNSIMKQCDIGILVSTFEGFPVTLLEYGIAKLAVISTNVGYCGNLIVNDKTGVLVNPLDLNSISNSISKLILDINYRKNLSSSFHTFVENNYTSEVVVNKIIDFYNL